MTVVKRSKFLKELRGAPMSAALFTFDEALEVNDEIYRLEALLKSIRIAAYDLADPGDSRLTVLPEEFPYLLDITIDRLSSIKEYMDKIEAYFRKMEENHA
ncbi:MAG: hypothetical protein CVU66_00620 [Deltaproteobacteria bacterium HGW-Deltaproteobacteria-23]|nr:MAG: hypothetical protein CVU66_00620 [Deltaproteobacteria bacterium HGW-Deltaproteobacteria-23]